MQELYCYYQPFTGFHYYKLSFTDYEVFNDEHMIRWDAMIALKAKTGTCFLYPEECFMELEY